MSKKQEDFRKNLLTKIHIHNRYKEIKENGCWEEWLELRYGCNSARFLSISELKEVLDIFNDKVQDRDYVLRDIWGRAQISVNKNKSSTKAQRLKIIALCKQEGFDEKGMCSFVYRQIKKHISGFAALYMLERDEASKVIVGLEKVSEWMAERERYANNIDFKA